MAVYTELSPEEVKDFLSLYDLPALIESKGILAGVENTNYMLTFAGGSKRILTLFEKRVAKDDLPFFMGFMQLLAQHGLPVPAPVAARNKEYILSLKGKPAVLVTFLPGKSANAVYPEHMPSIGHTAARMHLAGTEYNILRPNTLSLSGWRNIIEKITARADEITPGLAKEIQNEIKTLSGTWPENLPRGVIHADLFPDNVFYDAKNNVSGVIDFYFACSDFFAYDLAIVLNAWCFEKDNQFNITKAKLLLRAYNEVRPFSEAELDALPVLARGAALRFLLTRAHDWLFRIEGAMVKPKDPMEYLGKLRFHQKVKDHSEYGI